MKVLIKGTGQKGWSTRTHCTGIGNGGGGCNAYLMVEHPDLYHTYHHCYDGSRDRHVSFTCCECGVQTDIEGADHLSLPDKEVFMESKRKK